MSRSPSATRSTELKRGRRYETGNHKRKLVGETFQGSLWTRTIASFPGPLPPFQDHCLLRTHSQPLLCSAFCTALSVHLLHHSSSSTSLPFHLSIYVPMCPFPCIFSLPHWHPDVPQAILPSLQAPTRVSPAHTPHSLPCPAPPLYSRTAPAPTPQPTLPYRPSLQPLPPRQRHIGFSPRCSGGKSCLGALV